ncbi:MAG TPA: hypothetical protein VI455_00605 [Terriglobia bacterium]
MPDAAAILLVCRPTRFREALAVLAACERPIACVIHRGDLRSGRSLVASSLGVISYDTEASAWHSALRNCTQVLGSGGIILVFAGDGPDDRPNSAAWTLAREAWVGAFPGRPPVVVPSRLFWPAERAQEVLIYVGEPLSWDAAGDTAANFSEPARDVVHDTCGQNVFALQPTIVKRLFGSVEQALRDRLAAEWAARPGRKQKVDGFRLSPFAAGTFGRINQTEPEVLMALQQLSDADLDARRQWSLAKLRAEQGRKQLSAFQRLVGWTESIFGLPIACYGLLNHLIAGPILLAFGLSSRNQQASATPWIVRALIVLGCYTGQIVLVNRAMGRAAAGYYALTLPVSGVYLWRYWWLLRRRTRILLLGVKAGRLKRLVAKTHERFLKRLDGILESGAGPLGVP